ncbi:MAG TPA: fibronectin type III domain-containing protein, partial [Jatrophihabitantaceae bacterium]
SDLSQSEVVARGSRVIFNARANYEAEVVFSDGSHAPRTIDKHSAVQVDPSGATALTSAQARAAGPAKAAPPKTAPRPAQPVNDKINCSTSTQTPNIPTLIAGERGSRSVVLTWTYPLLDTSDCVPSTYVVSVKVLTAGSPSPPARVTVQGQDGVTLTGLFPATQYEITVTAYINDRGTTSQPIRVSTGPEGPAAPTRVRAATTATGDWTVSWTSCGGVKQGCVPSASWTIVPKFCDGRGLSNAPDPLSVTGDPTVHSFTATYPGSDGVLGRGVCFAVQGVSPQGTAGTVSAFTPAAYSWSPPIAGALRLSASQPATTTLGGTATTAVDLDLGSDPVKAVGGVGASITFALAGPGATSTKTIVYDGKSDHVATSFQGIAAGARYTASAVVHAPGHPSASASLQVNVTTRAQWPALSASADCASGGGPVVLSCALTVHIDGLSSAAAGGELFTLADNSGVVCGNTGFPLNKADFDPARAAITQDVNLLNYNGTCTVNLALREGANQRTPAVFGGTTSPTFSTNVNLGQASTLGAGQKDFTATWSDRGGSSALVRYTGGLGPEQVAKLSYGWDEHVGFVPSGSSNFADCTASGQGNSAPTADGVYVVLDNSCVQRYGGQDGTWQVTVSYHNTRDRSVSGPFTYSLNGAPPGYVAPPPCNVDKSSFTATWSGTATVPSVTVSFAGRSGDVAGCSSWTFVARDPSPQDCSAPIPGAGNPPADLSLNVTCGTAPSTAGWTVRVNYQDTDNHQQFTDIDVRGQVPQ